MTTKRPLSVLQMIPVAETGGAISVVVMLAAQLRALGVDVRVLGFCGGWLGDELTRLGVRYDIIPVRSKFDLRALAQLRAYLARERFDVVHTHLSRAMLFGNVAARWARTPVVVTSFHGLASAITADTGYPPMYLWLEGLLARLCSDGCAVWSEQLRRDVIRTRGVPASKTQLICNGVDTQTFDRLADEAALQTLRAQLGLCRDDVVIGAVGRLVRVKGHRHLIAALPYIRAHIPRARVVIAGDGPLRAELGALAQSCGLAEHVIFAGDLHETQRFYNVCDVFVSPSVQGVFGLVVLEAMACGVPLVASELPGVHELLTHEQTGLLVPPGDHEALGAAIVRLLKDASLRAHIAAKAYAHVRAKFSAAGIAREYLTWYQALLVKENLIE